MTYNPNRALLKLTGTLLMLILLGADESPNDFGKNH